MRHPRLVVVLIFALGSLASLGVLLQAVAREGDSEKPTPKSFSAKDVAFFDQQVRPILEQHCFKCHGGEPKIRGKLRLTSRADILKGGDSGAAVSLKNPAKSLLVNALNFGDFEMPPSGKLPAEQIATLTEWVKRGLPWKPGYTPKVAATNSAEPPEVNAKTKAFWSFQPVKSPKVPAVKNQAWVTNPIDAFVLAKLEQANLKPNGPASKAQLVRRAYYDLTGLPPSPEKVAEFLADKSPGAYEKVVDRLLASPRYGEKWARHWLDLVRYAETNSYERDGPKPFAWRYRDYVIRAFNNDKPYDRFLTEQLAGDELESATPETLIATGYYRLGIWDDEPVDPPQALYDDLDDIITTTSQVMLGLTINCCRCHDHKLDPLPQRDYYRFLAFFSGYKRFGVRGYDTVVRNSLRTIASPGLQKKHAAEVAVYDRKVKETAEKLKAIENIVRKDFIPVEKQEFRSERNQRALVKKRVPKVISQKQYDEFERLFAKRDSLRRNKPAALEMALCITEVGSKARDTHVLIRGSAHAKGDKVEPGFPSVLSIPDPALPQRKPDAKTAGRRAVLAQWFADRKNPLTSRVMANRIWQFHFGRGIVRSANNFGLQGTPPTHPQLLDWLAANFMDNGWKLKRLHKTIMLSSAYRMASTDNPAAAEKDPENNLFWRFNMRRLTAEEVRDSILAVNGSLNTEKMYGPSIYPIIPQEVLQGQSQPGAGWDKSSPEDLARRSIYIHIKRSLVVPMLASFDVADTDASCPVRFSTTQPTQALGLLNSGFSNRQAAVFVEYLKKQAGDNSRKQVALALSRTLQRTPKKEEIDRGVDLINLLTTKGQMKPDDALRYFCVVALNLNEFLYLD
jgi:hypothetical protein